MALDWSVFLIASLTSGSLFESLSSTSAAWAQLRLASRNTEKNVSRIVINEIGKQEPAKDSGVQEWRWLIGERRQKCAPLAGGFPGHTQPRAREGGELRVSRQSALD